MPRRSSAVWCAELTSMRPARAARLAPAAAAAAAAALAPAAPAAPAAAAVAAAAAAVLQCHLPLFSGALCHSAHSATCVSLSAALCDASLSSVQQQTRCARKHPAMPSCAAALGVPTHGAARAAFAGCWWEAGYSLGIDRHSVCPHCGSFKQAENLSRLALHVTLGW